MAQEGASAADELAASKDNESLSQFVARVLNQLSLSAWLPSAALVLSTSLIIQLGAQLDRGGPAKGWSTITAAFDSLARIGLGGGLLLFAAVIVLTTLTQAFSFEAIRFLEGYWGTTPVAEWWADRRVRRFGRRSESLRERYQDLTDRAWERARSAIDDEKARARRESETDNDTLIWSQDQLAYLGAKLRKKESVVRLDAKDRLAALKIPWEQFAPPDLLRRRVSLDKRLRDYPVPGRCLPTRLGNVLRAYEDRTGLREVETLVLEVYDQLPLSVRTRHDEHRNRLDLYASLIFVECLVAVLALTRFLPMERFDFAVGSSVIALALMFLTYRAAVASARVYGIVLLDVARRRKVLRATASAQG